jgi:uncharacterized protein (DUF1501 family)
MSRCIACEEIELARVREVRPTQTLPIPMAALQGFPEGRCPHNLTRRRLLQYGLAGFASVYAPRLLGWESVWESAAQAATPGPANCLVVLYLAGGNDTLNSLVPVPNDQYSAYASARSALHRGQGASTPDRVGSTPLSGPAGADLAWPNVVVSRSAGGDNGSTQYGFDVTYGAGQLAVMPAVDYTPPNLSHFTSSDYWFSGAEAQLSTGWLGRWVDRNGSATNPLQAVSIDQAISKDIRAARNPVSAIPSLGTLGFKMYGSPGGDPTHFDANAQMRQLAGVPASAANAYLTRSRSAYGIAVQAYDSARTLTLPPPPAGVTYPGSLADQSSLSYKLRMAALLLSANLGTRVVTIHWGSFDTHGDQVRRQDPQLTELSLALGAFQAELRARGIDQRVATLMFSEFGRRVHENAAAGTDHGAGGLMLLAGAPVRGGLTAPFPGCRSQDLDRTGNLQVATDFRSVYQAVLQEWLGDDPAAILPGTPAGGWPALQRKDGGSNLFR